MFSTRRAAATLAAATVMALAAPAGLAFAENADVTVAKKTPVYFVHGYGNGKDCNGSTWKDALKYFGDKGWDRDALKTVGYYSDDENCDVNIGGKDASKDTRIKHVAADLAHEIHDKHTSKGEKVEIVAHSMGGLITRVALLGSAKGWQGFPPKLDVGDVVTLGTPHKGVRDPDASGTTQWKSMRWGSEFMKVLHAPENRLSGKWAQSTDWSFVSSDQDETVSGDSAIDKDYAADHKYRFLKGNDPAIDHGTIRTDDSGKHELRHWHGGDPKETSNGWSPVETAFNALDRNGDA